MNPADQVIVKGKFRVAVTRALEAYIKDMDNEIEEGSTTIPDWREARVTDHLENFGSFLIDEREVLLRGS